MLRSRRGRAALAVVVALAFALAANTIAVDQVTRASIARSGGGVMETGVVPTNVKVEGEGPPTVLIHGFGAALDWWDEIAPRLAAGHRVIRLDLIGHGGTEAPASGYTIERQAKLYRHLGFKVFGPPIGTAAAPYRAMYVTWDDLAPAAKKLGKGAV